MFHDPGQRPVYRRGAAKTAADLPRHGRQEPRHSGIVMCLTGM